MASMVEGMAAVFGLKGLMALAFQPSEQAHRGCPGWSSTIEEAAGNGERHAR